MWLECPVVTLSALVCDRWRMGGGVEVSVGDDGGGVGIHLTDAFFVLSPVGSGSFLSAPHSCIIFVVLCH